LETGLKLDFENWFKTGLNKKTGLVQKLVFTTNRFRTSSEPYPNWLYLKTGF